MKTTFMDHNGLHKLVMQLIKEVIRECAEEELAALKEEKGLVIQWTAPNLADEVGEYFENESTKEWLKKKGIVFQTTAELVGALKTGKLATITKNELTSNPVNLTLNASDFNQELEDDEYASSFQSMEKELLSKKEITLPAPIVLKVGSVFYGFAGNRRMNLAFKHKIPLKIWLVPLKSTKASLSEGVMGTLSTGTSSATTGTSGTTASSGTKPVVGTKPGNDDPANNVMIPNTNMNINQALIAASKETNFKKKAELASKISKQIDGMKGVVVKEGDEGEPALLEWQVLHRALSKALKNISNQYDALYNELTDKGGDANKIIRSLENVLDNMKQDLQMKKDVGATKARAQKAMAKSPFLKKFLPVELGGEFVSSLGEAMDEPEVPMMGGKKISTREPMFPELVNRITNMVYYENLSDDEIMFMLQGENLPPKLVRWAKFMADMVRKGKDL